MALAAGCNSSKESAPTTTGGGSGGGSTANAPVLADQWHLINTGQLSGTAGEDLNVDSVWTSYKGEGVRVVVVDDGMEIAHTELSPNVVSGKSFNYLNNSTNPTNPSSDTDSGHGTSVAGILAAYDESSTDLRGVAPRAALIGYNLLNNYTTSTESAAMTRDIANISVSSNSWGAEDGTGLLQAANSTWKTAIDTGLSTGRSGRGTIYVWAAGNGASTDNSNYDGQANYHGVIAVGALTNKGKNSSYSEKGANIWVAAPGGEFCSSHAITTIDRTGTLGFNTNSTAGSTDVANTAYTKCMNGTSSATPMVSGVVALVLQAKSTLGYRDVRRILAQTARKNDAGNGQWATNGAGYHIHPFYGFGAIDADAAVNAALAYGSNLPAQIVHSSATKTVNTAIPDNNTTGVSDTINISGSGINDIEWVEITFTAANHTYAGDLAITLTAPSGTTSELAVTHGCDNNTCVAYSGWVFGSARHFDESADGNWTLTVKDGAAQDTGTFQSWQLKIRGH